MPDETGAAKKVKEHHRVHPVIIFILTLEEK